MIFKRFIATSLVVLVPTTVLALGRGFDPALQPVVDSRSGLATEVWKLAGYVTGAASAVQIAPHWILAAAHATPPVGAQFKNAFGQATVSDCTPYAAEDLVLCSLSTTIPTPAGFSFPELVESPSALVSGQFNSLPSLAAKLGVFLTVGHGAPTVGLPRYVWSDLMSFSVSSDNLPGTLGIAAPSPYGDSGDSGSPVFWFPNGSTKVGLIGVRRNGGPVGPFRLRGFGYGFSNSVNPSINAQPVPSVVSPLNLFDKALLASITSKVNADGRGALQASLASSFVGDVQPTPMWLGRAVLTVKASKPTSVNLGWADAIVGASTQNFIAFVQQQGGPVVSMRNVRADLRSVSLSGMSPGISYVACVLPNGAQGSAPLGSASYPDSTVNFSDAHLDFSASCLPIKLAAAPTAVSDFTATFTDRKYPVGTYKTETFSWGRPTTPALPDEIRYLLTVTVNGVFAYEQELTEKTYWQGGPRLTPGEKICGTVTPISSPKTLGPKSAEQCVTFE